VAKQLVEKLVHAAGKTRVTPKDLRNNAAAFGLLEGKSWELKMPGLVDSQRCRKFLDKLKKEKYPKRQG